MRVVLLLAALKASSSADSCSLPTCYSSSRSGDCYLRAGEALSRTSTNGFAATGVVALVNDLFRRALFAVQRFVGVRPRLSHSETRDDSILCYPLPLVPTMFLILHSRMSHRYSVFF